MVGHATIEHDTSDQGKSSATLVEQPSRLREGRVGILDTGLRNTMFLAYLFVVVYRLLPWSCRQINR